MSIHSRHCCVIHGCKYGDEDCPVVLRKETQEYPCETCSDNMNEWYFPSEGQYPKIPEGKYGIVVNTISFDPVYSSDPIKNLSLGETNYSNIYDRYGKILDNFKGSIYELNGNKEAFMELYVGDKCGLSWGPTSDEIIAWRYKEPPTFLTSYVLEKTKEHSYEN